MAAPNGSDASLDLAEVGGSNWFVKSEGSTNKLIVGESASNWLSIDQTGSSTFQSDVTAESNLIIGGGGTTGAKAMNIQSMNDAASLSMTGTAASLLVTSTGVASDTALTVTAGNGHTSKLSLVESNGTSFHLLNSGADNKMKINDGTNDLFTLAATSGDVTIKGGLNVKAGKFVIDATTGYAGIWTSNPQAQLHVNGSMIVENGDFKVGASKFYINHKSGFVGINNQAPSEAMHIKGNVRIERDNAGNGGHLFATDGAVHFKFKDSAQGIIDREYYMATDAGVTLPTDVSVSCTSHCIPTSSRIYVIRNKLSSGTITITASTTVKLFKNGVQGSMNSGASMVLNANGMAMCAFNTEATRYDCWTWNE